MWPFRPSYLSELVGTEALARVLALGLAHHLRSDVAILEERDAEHPDGSAGNRTETSKWLARIDPPEPARSEYRSPFCAYLRRETYRGEPAFEGADAACAACEERFARRALAALREAPEEVLSARCHMGLQDFAAAIRAGGRPLAVIVAGQRVASEEDRQRIAKRVGKLGKLTRAEARSLEEAQAPVEPAIRPADEGARQRLLAEIAQIPPVESGFPGRLAEAAQTLSAFAEAALRGYRLERAQELLESLPQPPPTGTDPAAFSLWAHNCTEKLRAGLGCEFLALFAPVAGSEEIGQERLPLAAESSLTPFGSADILGDVEALAVDLRKLRGPPTSGTGVDEEIESARRRVSELIGALEIGLRAPADWKDRLTKALLAARIESGGRTAIAVVGPAQSAVEAEMADFAVLLGLLREFAARFLSALAEREEKRLKGEVERLRPKPKAETPSPIRTQRFDLRKLLDQVLEAARTAAPAEVEVDTRGLPQRFMLLADRSRLYAVFECILRDAIGRARQDVSEGAPALVLSTRRPKRGGGICVVVDVVGRFLDADERRALFARERRERRSREAAREPASEAQGEAPPSAEEKGAGTPVREAAVAFHEARRYVAWHGGGLHIDSERTHQDAEGRWLGRTVYTITLPASCIAPRLPREGGGRPRREAGPKYRTGESKPPREEPASGGEGLRNAGGGT